jgi:tRNA A-37 threonylcarbamoyl transferase component Bud32
VPFGTPLGETPGNANQADGDPGDTLKRERSGQGAPSHGPLSDYELLEELARGGMGVVYKARQLSLNRVVALKMILHGVDDGESRFQREAEAAAALDHPNIVSVYATGQHDGRPFLAMAYVEGSNLGEVVRRGGVPTPQEALALFRPVVEAVAFAHQHGIIHRDLKPENVLIDRQGRPRVTDFGLAKRIGGGASLTVSGQVLGTPTYMAPEQALGRTEEIGPPTDVYSLGGILYFLLTGRPPFQGRTVTDVLVKVAQSSPTPPREVNPDAPAELEAVCMRCLEKEPGDRYATADLLLAALEPLAAHFGPPPSRASHPAAPRAGATPQKPGRSLRVALCLLLLGCCAALGLWLTSDLWWPGDGGQVPPPDAGKGPGQPAPEAAATPLTLPEKLRTDFGIEVEMVGGRQGDDGVRRLKPGEEVRLKIAVASKAYVGVWSVNGDGTISQLFPNAWEKDHLFQPGQPRVVPQTRAIAEESKGLDRIWVQASTHPWEPSEGERVGPFVLFQTEREREGWAQRRRGVRLQPMGTLAEAVVKFQVAR